MFDTISALIAKAPRDQVLGFLSVMAAYPLAFVHSHIRNPTIRNLYSIFFGVLTSIVLLGPFGWFHAFFSSTVVYIMCSVLPPNIIPTAVSIFSIAYMTCSHFYRMWNWYLVWALDFTAPQMIVTIKLMSYAFNLSDGNAIKMGKKLNMDQHFYTSHFVRKHDDDKNPQIPSTQAAAFRAFLRALCCAPFLALTYLFPPSLLHYQSFFDKVFPIKVVILYLMVLCYRARLYIGWWLAEGAFVASGFGFNGYTSTGEVKSWDRITNNHFWETETAQSTHILAEKWNASTACWLKNYCYLRLTSNGHSGAISSFWTFMLSAFWHGVYPGYYLSFAYTAMLQYLGRLLRRTIRPVAIWLRWKPVYDLACAVLLGLYIGFAFSPFILLELGPSLRIWRSLWFVALLPLVAIAGLQLVSPARILHLDANGNKAQRTDANSATPPNNQDKVE
ncbi:membrane bound O-acyl transferase family protein [Pelomyxa schiedti]|nr:membrane bound O-acyl transferase family protein [Pelomyxa schiedti]